MKNISIKIWGGGGGGGMGLVGMEYKSKLL